MDKVKLPNKKYLVFVKDCVNGYGGLDDLVLSFDNEKSGKDKLEHFVNKNPFLSEECSYQLLIKETLEYIHFRNLTSFTEYLESRIEENKKSIIPQEHRS